jgi:hypothetical protein
MKFRVIKSLTEAADEQILYQDAATGKLYKIEGGQFVEVKLEKGKPGEKGQSIQTPYPIKDEPELPPDPPVDPFDDDDDDWDLTGEGALNTPRGQMSSVLREIQILKEKINDLDGSYEEDIDKDIDDISQDILDSPELFEKELEKLKNQLNDLRREFVRKGGTLTDDEEEEQKKKDIEEIKDILQNPEAKKEIMDATHKKVFASRQQKLAGERAAAAAEKRAAATDADVIAQLKSSLQRTLKAEIKEYQDYSWAKFNKKAHAAGLIAPGIRREEKIEIPSINVYFDRSGSWGPEKSIFGQNAVDSIAYLAKKKLLKLRLYFFNNSILEKDPGTGYGGTDPRPVLQHIKDTKPDNVLVMTDSDFDWYLRSGGESVTVPGMVWLLYKEEESEYLGNFLKGKKGTKSYFVK